MIDSDFEACGTIEGFTNDDPTKREVIEAWAHLIRTGTCWHLQGFYGRGARDVIEAGTVSPEGEITEYGQAVLDEEGDEKAYA